MHVYWQVGIKLKSRNELIKYPASSQLKECVIEQRIYTEGAKGKTAVTQNANIKTKSVLK